MILPSPVSDEFNQQVEPERTFVRYEVRLAVRRGGPLSTGLQLRLVDEWLSPVQYPKDHLRFPESPTYVKRFVHGAHRSPPLSTTEENGNTIIQIRNGNRGRPRKIAADNAQRTVLSATASAENPTILAAQTEMRSWRFVALEPSAMRAPDDMVETRPISATGAHIPSSLFRQELQEGNGSNVMNRVRDAIGALVDIRHLRVVQDRSRDTLELRAKIGATPELPARSLSDGTLRFLALSAMKVSRDYFGMLCMEEPENGIHPSKIVDMHRLLRGISDPTEHSARQVIVNTHSPYFVQATKNDDILCAVGKSIPDGQGGVLRSVGFHPLPGTWRARTKPEDSTGARPVSRGEIAAFLENPDKWNGDEDE
ncbi:AAA family ATPase [Schaalia georgiae]|uniref:AAA family ATPase n=1 Tax=Schaalia georgiae TaxID=52768 RepID=UPI00040EC54A|nr:AAA family ATPase [Schaalia georgiae]